MFAEKYLEKNQNVTLIPDAPNPACGIIVVIPCFREPDIRQTLDSLNSCTLPVCNVEVIVAVNHSEIASSEVKKYNSKTVSELQNWIKENQRQTIHYYVVGPLELRKKWAGAGLARKQGMDEAVRRFNSISKSDGIIVSLDADTLVEENYLLKIEDHFKKNPKHVGATIAFEHQKQNLNKKQLEGIELYELYLRYYKMALQYIGYPHAMFTVGSAFAVRAGAYVRRGGMNRRQAGEDFYFLQNLAQLGPIGEIVSTRVHPSARLSDRVPFGTGPILLKWMNGEEDLTKTYDFQLFIDLKFFFDRRSAFYKMTKKEFEIEIENYSETVKIFLQTDGFWSELEDLNKNCATAKAFEIRFFQKFNAFKILKYLNFGTDLYFPQSDLSSQMDNLLQKFSNNFQIW